MENDFIALKDFIENEIESSSIQKIKTDKNIFIQCPYPHRRHKDTDPSLSINIDESKPIGMWNCFGCGNSGSWNTLAPDIGLATYDFKEDKEGKFAFHLLETELKWIAKEEEELRYIIPNNLEEIKKNIIWRNLKHDFLAKLPTYKIYDDYAGQYRLYFPMYHNNYLVGDAKLLTKKAKNKNIRKVLYSPKAPVKKILFPNQLINENHKTVVLVEGVYDSLRLWNEGIPALAILGTHSWSELKLTKLISMGIEKVIVCMDGDEPGHKASDEVCESCTKKIRTLQFKIPINEKKIDPGNMPKSYLTKIKNLL